MPAENLRFTRGALISLRAQSALEDELRLRYERASDSGLGIGQRFEGEKRGSDIIARLEFLVRKVRQESRLRGQSLIALFFDFLALILSKRTL
jgi:hypothetical protein